MKETRKKARCQCIETCNNPPLKNSPFCATHIRFCPRKSQLSGYEPDFNPDIYNKYKGIKEAQNCFAYAFDYRTLPKIKNCTKNECSIPFPQPGRASGYKKWSEENGKRCPNLLARLFGDVKDIKISSFERKCPRKYSKIALVVDEDEDYHFYRQDSNGLWSHKPGSTNVTHIDGSGRPIHDPQLASRYYPDSGINYDEFCSYLCVPKHKRFNFKRGGSRKTRKRKNHFNK